MVQFSINSCERMEGETQNIPSSNSSSFKFRNYVPFDAKLKELAISSNENGKQKENISQNSTSKKSVILQELENMNEEEINIIPNKQNSDLKDQIASKLAKLKKRTQKSIVEILKERIAKENEEASDEDV